MELRITSFLCLYCRVLSKSRRGSTERGISMAETLKFHMIFQFLDCPKLLTCIPLKILKVSHQHGSRVASGVMHIWI